jgi:hypothetical protein
VRVDDAEPQAARGPLTIRVNPGTHLVTGEASGHATVRQAVTVQPGESTEVRLGLRADAPEPATIARASRSGGSARPFTADDESSGPSAWTSPWLWIGVGAVVAGAVIAIVLAVASGGSSELVRGNFAPEARAVR